MNMRPLRTIVLAALTPLLEKNVIKTITVDMPVVFSMSRVIVLAFAVAMLRQIWRAGIAGWPDATLAIAIVLALPMSGARTRQARRRPGAREDARRSLRRGRWPHDRRACTRVEPSKFDDHQGD